MPVFREIDNVKMYFNLLACKIRSNFLTLKLCTSRFLNLQKWSRNGRNITRKRAQSGNLTMAGARTRTSSVGIRNKSIESGIYLLPSSYGCFFSSASLLRAVPSSQLCLPAVCQRGGQQAEDWQTRSSVPLSPIQSIHFRLVDILHRFSVQLKAIGEDPAAFDEFLVLISEAISSVAELNLMKPEPLTKVCPLSFQFLIYQLFSL